MTKFFCDRCGKEVTDKKSFNVYAYDGADGDRDALIDKTVCGSCFATIKKVIYVK